MNYHDLQMLQILLARQSEVQYEEKQPQWASPSFQVKQRRSPWIGLLTVLVVLAIVIWRLL